MRPGQTIPVIGNDNQLKYNDALNTSFGTPPVLVLRIGDFYHTKIIPNSLGISFDPLVYDLNPEGIGVQPMIVKVSMNFKIIGGMGLAKPVEQLQNALSFNFYANTEIYDERATATEDISARDKYVVEKILASQPPVSVAEIKNTQPKKGGNTIGTILSDTQIDYTSQINDFWKILPLMIIFGPRKHGQVTKKKRWKMDRKMKNINEPEENLQFLGHLCPQNGTKWRKENNIGTEM